MGVRPLRRGAVSVFDYRCEARPGDKPFAEVHAAMSVSYVRSGSFGYRARGKTYDLVAGSVLIGHASDEFTCTHDHAYADRCLSFHLAPEVAEEIAGSAFWRSACIPPLEAVVVIGELAAGAAEGCSNIDLDEAGLLLAHRSASITRAPASPRVSERDRKRVIETAAWIDMNCAEEINLHAAAGTAGLSPFYFLRMFTRVLEVTPHQYLVRSRLRRAARLLATSDCPVTEIALESGFNDVANFTRTFTRAAGRSPGAYRNFCKA